MFSKEFYQKCFQRPASQSSYLDDIKQLIEAAESNLFGNINGSIIDQIKNKTLNFTQGGLDQTSGSIFPIIFLIWMIWYLFFNDRNLALAFYERFGRGVSRFKGKVVWLIGASTSMGEAMALELAAKGAKLILSARRTDILKQIKDECIEKSKGKISAEDIFVLPYDVTEMKETFTQSAIDHFGKIDVLVNNIGHIELGEVDKMEMAVDKALFEVNFFGPVFVTKQIIKHFKAQGGGQIIVISSISGKFGIPGLASASASKHALQGYYEALRTECQKYKIYVTIVCPGMVRSSITDHVVLAGSHRIPPAEQEKMSRKGVKTKRCAHLALLAAANNCYECWVCNQPLLLIVDMSQNFPTLHKYLMSYIFTDERLNKIYTGKSPGIWGWKPLFVI